MDIYCWTEEPGLCLFCDKKGKTVRVQISYSKPDADKVDPNLFNFRNPSFVQTNFLNSPAYSARVFFVKPDELTEDGRNSSSSEIIDGLWAKVDGELLRFDTRCQPNSPVIDGQFFMQGCLDMVGQVYSRHFHGHSECRNAFWLYLIFDQGSLVGFGHAAPSVVFRISKEDVYFHVESERKTEKLLPDRPKCYYDLAKYDFSAVLIFLIEDPWKIRCPKCLCGK